MKTVKQILSATLVSTLLVGGTGLVNAQSITGVTGQDAALVEQFEQAKRIKAADANKGALRTKILADWRATAVELKFDIPRWEAKLTRWLNMADGERLLKADAAIHYDHLVAILKGWDSVAQTFLAEEAAMIADRKALKVTGLPNTPKVLGAPSTDLVYVPLANTCRFYASSDAGTNGGFFGAPNSNTRFFTVDGSAGAYAGGAVGCDTGGVEPAAIVATVTSFANNGGGFFLLRPFSGAAGSSTINMQTSGALGNDAVANTTIVKVCQGCSNDIALESSFGTGVVSHVIIDIIGYYVPPQATPLDCVREHTTFIAPVFSGSGRTFNSGTVCRTGYTFTGSGCYAFNNDVYVESTATYSSTPTTGYQSGGQAYCSVVNYSGAPKTVYQDTFCCRVPGR